jgi:hypothetical protein
MVFQPPQASHLPDHFGAVAPQDWQTKLVWDLAMVEFYHVRQAPLPAPISNHAVLICGHGRLSAMARSN